MSLPVYAPNFYLGTGGVATYSYSFKIFAYSDLRVIKVSTLGVKTVLAYTTDFTATGVGSAAGGSITLVAGNLPLDYQLVIKSNRSHLQDVSIKNQTEFFAATHETAFDKLARLCQQLKEAVDRSIRLAESADASGFDLHLPPTLDAGSTLVVAPNGLGFVLGPTDEELAQAIVDASTASAAAAAAAASAASAAAALVAALLAQAGAQVAQAASETAKDGAEDARDAAQALVLAANLWISAGPFTVNNNSSSALSGQTHDHTTHTQIDFVSRVIRGTTVFSRDEFSIFYRDGAWELVPGFDRGVAPSGITYTVHASTGQITAAADNGAGNATIDLKKLYWAI